MSDPVPGFTERAVEADGFTIRVLEAGAGRPLVYFHGGGGLHVSPAHRLLAERFRVSAFELPGFGESPENTRTATLDELAATMAAAVAAAGIDRYALYGTSFGAATALRLAVAFEERLESLVLESPAAFRDPAVNPSALTPDELRRALFVRPENGPPPQPLPVIQKQLALLNRLIGPAADPELRERMRGLAVPTLVVVGRSDGLIPPALGRVYKELLVSCSLVYVYDAAHEVQFDRPEALAGLVGDFLDRQEAFIVQNRSHVLVP